MGGHSCKSHTKHWGKAKSGVVKATLVYLVENFSVGKVVLHARKTIIPGVFLQNHNVFYKSSLQGSKW